MLSPPTAYLKMPFTNLRQPESFFISSSVTSLNYNRKALSVNHDQTRLPAPCVIVQLRLQTNDADVITVSVSDIISLSFGLSATLLAILAIIVARRQRASWRGEICNSCNFFLPMISENMPYSHNGVGGHDYSSFKYPQDKSPERPNSST
jgi:hypothetical protein